MSVRVNGYEREREREHETEMLLSVQDEEKKRGLKYLGKWGLVRGGLVGGDWLLVFSYLIERLGDSFQRMILPLSHSGSAFK